MSVVSVCSGKGSPGATFCAINLASALAGRGDDVLLLDLDPAGGDVAAYLGLDTRRGFYPLLRMDNGLPDAAALLAEAEERAGVHAVCGFPEPSALSTSVDLLARTVEEAGAERTVLCDLGRVTEQSAQVAARSGLVLLVVRPDLVSVLGAERALRRLESARAERERIGVVVSCAERRRPADLAEVAGALGLDVIGSTPLHRPGARRMLASQMPVDKGPLARAFRALAVSVGSRLAAFSSSKEGVAA